MKLPIMGAGYEATSATHEAVHEGGKVIAEVFGRVAALLNQDDGQSSCGRDDAPPR